jgi:hypothetical protein
MAGSGGGHAEMALSFAAPKTSSTAVFTDGASAAR